MAEMPHVESVSVGIWLGVGGRYEPARIGGVSHFIEHVLFKGTRRRTAREISEAVEGVGGYLNAFTAEEMTCYFAKASATHFPVLADVLVDMVARATFSKVEIERERGVITEEIRMYDDQPGQLAQERLNMLLWPNHPLGRPLAGTLQSVEKMSRADLLDHLHRHYHRGNLWVTVAGKVKQEDVARLFKKLLQQVPSGNRTVPKPVHEIQSRPIVAVYKKPIEQSHLALGLRGVSRHSPRRFAVKLLNVILGENMSSRLFQSVRERHGLAYSINSSASYFSDTGSLVVTAGVENSKLTKSLKLILHDIRKLAEKGPTAQEVKRAKEYSIGQMHLSLESTTNQIMWMGEGLIGHGRVLDPKKITEQMEAVTAEEIRSTAAMLASNRRLALAVVSPTATEREVAEVTRF